jgi:hypothetical protein
MDARFDTEYGAPPKQSDFTLILGCVFLSIVMTGGTGITTKLVLNLVGLY